jgi:mono/diheme cytochrome c family protein
MLSAPILCRARGVPMYWLSPAMGYGSQIGLRVSFWRHFVYLAGNLLLATLTLALQAATPSGKQVFVQRCAKCHGRSGEGVKGKYDSALQGDRALDKLIHYIERNMPDDAPGTCTNAAAAAVARYIYDQFYSLEARGRKNPARIELVRLTNRQYVNTVADLIKHFTGGDNNPGAEHGLNATYYNSRNLNDAKKAFERVDHSLDFDFGEGSPISERGTNGFSIQWRGSIIADEPGEYEFVVKTPNGARLWLNDEEEPLIDAWVSSGQLTDHKATIRLLGGRPYPLRLNYFKWKDKTASNSLQWKPPHSTLRPIPARNLATRGCTPTFVVSTPFPPDDSSVGYERGVSISKAWDEATTQAAVETANYVLEKLDALSRSKPGDSNRTARLESFCSEFAARAFRHPLRPDEARFFVQAQFKKSARSEDAVKRVVLLTLKSPQFLYLGLGGGHPSQFETASRLSFALWDSLPDDALWKAAEQGSLNKPEQIAQHANRMVSEQRTRAKLQVFFQHWLQMDRVEPVSKDEQLYPGFTPEIIADLRTSLTLFLDDAVWNGSSDYRALLQADYLFLNQRLASFYGVPWPENTALDASNPSDERSSSSPDDFLKTPFSTERRSGVLTHPYLLSAFSYQKLTSPIHRGVFLTRNIVGRALRPPPMAMTFKDADFAPNLTMREKVAQLTSPQACQGCHSVINPLGFSLESYDAVGRFRTEENAKPINATSDYLTDNNLIIHLSGARDIAELAINNPQAQNAFIEQLFHHMVKQPVRAYGPDVMNRLRQGFVASGFNIRKLLAEIAIVSASHVAGPT